MKRPIRIALACAVFIVIAAGVHRVLSTAQPVAGTEPGTFTTADPDTVTLTDEKLAASQLAFATADMTRVQNQTLVAGRIQYDDRRHVEIRSATAGIITQIPVKPGDRVKKGDILVVLNSSEVGNARADVLQQSTQVELAMKRRDWERQTSEGLSQLVDAVRRRVPVEQIREQFRNTTLGKSREQLLTAYSDLLLSEVLLTSAGNGGVSGRIVEERRSARDQAEATLSGSIEQLTFEATLASQSADAELADAQQRLMISRQTVRTLLGQSLVDDGETPETPTTGSTNTDAGSAVPVTEPLSLVRLRAPFDGTIERRVLTESERVEGGTSILTLADTSTLWVAADLRERDWSALSLRPGDPVAVTTSAISHQSRSATIHFVGREVDPQTNAIPLVALVDNADGQLRPGMPARISLPQGNTREMLTVPEEAVMQHDGRTFVFIPKSDRAFRMVDVVTGTSTSGRTEILSGLTAGATVVTANAFLLKSELLLQGEDD